MVSKNLLLYLYPLNAFKKKHLTVLPNNHIFILKWEVHSLELQKLLINDDSQLKDKQRGTEFSKILREYVSK